MLLRKLSVDYRLISDLQPDPRNPRRHSARQIKQIAKSIETFGFNVPLLINQQNQIIAGHGRLAAAKLLQMEHVPTLALEHLSDSQAQAFLIADNRLTENAEWDDQLLAQQFKELAELDLSFALDTTGFEMAEIDLLIDEFCSAPDHSDAEEEPTETGPPVSRGGDLWLLGKHRLLCGDALNAADFERLLDGRQANMVFTDPPYNVPIDGYATGFGKIHHAEFVMGAGEMTEPEFIAFLTTVCKNLAAHSTDGSLHFLCIDWHHVFELLTAGRAAYSELKNLCVWAKDNGGQGSLYRSQHELILVFKNGSAPHCNNIQLGQFGRYRTNVWHYAGANSFSKAGDEGNLLALHPTVKPVAMVADAILDCSRRGEIILDSFVGSGTTFIAAEKTGRICYGLELDPRHIDTAVERWQRFTGLKAIHQASSKTFEEIRKERANGN